MIFLLFVLYPYEFKLDHNETEPASKINSVFGYNTVKKDLKTEVENDPQTRGSELVINFSVSVETIAKRKKNSINLSHLNRMK